MDCGTDDGGGFCVSDDDNSFDPTPADHPQPPRHAAAQSTAPLLGEDLEGEAALEEALGDMEARGAPLDRSRSTMPTRPTGSCIQCQAADGQQKFRVAFSLEVCYECQRANRGEGGKFQVISKSKAKSDFLVTDTQLDGRTEDGLGSFSLPNPHDSRYGEMRLYLRTQVEEVSLRTWGSAEGLLLAQERRSRQRIKKAAAKKRGSSVWCSDGGSIGVRDTSPAAARKRGKGSKGATSAPFVPPHEHDFFPAEECGDGLWTRQCDCGFSESFEKI